MDASHVPTQLPPTSTRRCFRSARTKPPIARSRCRGSPTTACALKIMGRDVLVIEREAIRALAEAAFGDISHLLRPGTSRSCAPSWRTRKPQTTTTSSRSTFSRTRTLRRVAFCRCARTPVLRSSWEEGAARVHGGRRRGGDRGGCAQLYLNRNLRYTQLAPLTMYEEKNTGNNLPAQIEIYAENDREAEYKFLFIAKGGGSANKAFLPGDAVDPDARPPDRVPQGEDPHARHRGVPALSSGDLHRRHLGGADHEDGEARLPPSISTTCQLKDPRTATRSATSRWSRRCSSSRSRSASARSSAASTSATTCG